MLNHTLHWGCTPVWLPFLTKNILRMSPSQVEGKKGSLQIQVVQEGLWWPKVHVLVYDPVFIPYCILKPKPPEGSVTVHTWLHLPHTSLTSSPLPAGSTAQFSPSASHPPRLVLAGGFLLPLWHTGAKNKSKTEKLAMSERSTKLFKKGSELGNRKLWWPISEDGVIIAHFPKSLGFRDQDNKTCCVSSSCIWSMLQCLSDLTLLENPALIRVKNLKPEKFWKSGQRLPVQWQEIFQTSVNSIATDNYWETQYTRRMSACSWFLNFSCISDRQVWPTTQTYSAIPAPRLLTWLYKHK